MKKLILLLAVLPLLISCNKDDISEGTAINLFSFAFSVQDKSGNDLLTSETPGYIPLSQIKVSYIDKQGNRIFMTEDDMGYKNKYPGQHYDDSYYLIAKPETPGVDFGGDFLLFGCFAIDAIVYNGDFETATKATSTYYIHWDENTVDKVECKFLVKRSNICAMETIINGITYWSEYEPKKYEEPYFKIVVDGDQRTIANLDVKHKGIDY